MPFCRIEASLDRRSDRPHVLVQGSDPCQRAARRHWLAKMAEPASGGCKQPSGLKPVHVLTPPQLDRDEPGQLKHAQMLGCGRPGVLEPGGDGARRHLAAVGMQGGKDCPPGPVRERAENRVEVIELGESPGLGRHVPSVTRS